MIEPRMIKKRVNISFPVKILLVFLIFKLRAFSFLLSYITKIINQKCSLCFFMTFFFSSFGRDFIYTLNHLIIFNITTIAYFNRLSTACDLIRYRSFICLLSPKIRKQNFIILFILHIIFRLPQFVI